MDMVKKKKENLNLSLLVHKSYTITTSVGYQKFISPIWIL